MTKIKLLFTFIIIFLLSSCKQIAEFSIESSVEDLNEKCPVRLGEVDVLKKVEYRNNAICFYVTEDEENEDFGQYTSEQKEKIEKSIEFKRVAIGMCLTNKVVQEELNITKKMADETGLIFRVFIKGGTSKCVLKTEISWEEIQDFIRKDSEW